MDARERLIRIVLVLLLLYAAGCLAAGGRRVQRAELELQRLVLRNENDFENNVGFR